MQTRKRSYLLLVIGAALSVVPSNAQVSSGTTYTLVARHSGQFLDVLGAATANGSPVGQSTGHGGSNQQWLIESLGSGQYRLTGVGSGKPLDINQASTADNAPAIISTWNGGNNQRVTLQDRGNGYYSLIFVHSGKALAVQNGSTASGAAVVQAPNDGSTHTQWKFTKGPAGYIFAGDEGASRTFSGGKVDLAYGAGNSFHFVNKTDGTWTFNNATFRDPIFNTLKNGYYKATNTSGPAGYTYCAPENGTFTFTQPANVAYGANGNFAYQNNVTGTVTFSNGVFTDPAPGVVKSGWFKALAPLPPTPPSLSGSNLNDFIANHARYEGASAAAYSPEFQSFLTYMGGDVFYPKMFGPGRWTNSMLNITASYSGAAGSSGGNTWYNKGFWDSDVGQRVPVLIHEYMHHMDNGSGLSNFYNAEQADPAKRWDGSGYANVSPAEYIASGFQWIVQNPTGRQTVFENHPAFYLHMVNTFIPQFYTPW